MENIMELSEILHNPLSLRLLLILPVNFFFVYIAFCGLAGENGQLQRVEKYSNRQNVCGTSGTQIFPNAGLV